MRIQRNTSVIRRTAFLLLLSMLLSVFTGYSYAASAEDLPENNSADDMASEVEETELQPIETEDQIFTRLTADTQILNYIDETAFRAAGHVKRLPEEEDLHSYVFENADGTRTAYIMNEPVKYVDSTGAVREKNLTLSTGKISGNTVLATTVNTDAYTVTATDYPTAFPNDISKGVRFTYGEYTLNLRPETVNASTTAIQADGKMLYRNAFGATAHLMYTPQLSGLKEDIVLTKYSGINTFSFLLDTDGLIPAEDAGGWYLWDGIDPEMQVRFGQVISYDAKGDFSIGTMTIQHQSGTTYRLTLTVDMAFLTDENTAYPVTVDPSITVTDSADAMEDIVLFEGAPNATYTSMQYNTVGASSLGTGITAFRLKGLYQHPVYTEMDYQQIESVYFYVWDYSSVAQTIHLYPLLENTTWNENNATWNNIGNYDLSYNICSSNLQVKQQAVFNITDLVVNGWKEKRYDPNAGFVLVGNPSVEKKIYSLENTNTARRPYVVMNYDNRVVIDCPTGHYAKADQELSLRAFVNPNPVSVIWTTSDSSIVALSATAGTQITATGGNVGTATIKATATFADGTTGSGSYEITITYNGIYLLNNDTPISDNEYYLQSNSNGETAMVSTQTQTGNGSELFRYWRIVHRGGGQYIIRSMADPSRVLSVVNGQVCVLEVDSSSITDGNLWYIKQGQYWINFISKTDTTKYLATTGITQTYERYSCQNLKLASTNEPIEHRSWLPIEVTTAGMLFRSLSATGISFKEHFSKSMEISNAFVDLEDVGYELYTYSSDGVELVSLTWQSSNPDALWISSGAGLMKSISLGTYTLTATAVFSNGTSISRSFTLTVTGLTNTTYYIQNSRTNLYMGLASEYNATNNRQIRQKEADELSTPRWLVRHVSEAYYVIHVYLNGTHYAMKAEGSNIVLAPYPSSGYLGDSMLFRFETRGNDEYSIFPKSGEASNLAVTANPTASENGDCVVLQSYSETYDYQHWRLLSPTSNYVGNDIYTIETEIQYDYGYLTRVGNGNAINRLKNHMLQAQHFYLLNFGVYFKFTLKQSVEASYADTYCPGKVVSGSNITWDMTKCVGCDISMVKHHGDTESIYYNMTRTREITVMFTGHDLCTTSDDHYDPIGGYYTSRYDSCIVGHSTSFVSELSTFIHELGHILGANDHYGNIGQPSTAYYNKSDEEENPINPEDEKYYYGPDVYSPDCYYGENNHSLNVENNQLLCNGCRRTINDTISEMFGG